MQFNAGCRKVVTATRNVSPVCRVIISSILVQESGRLPRAVTLICTGNDSITRTSTLSTAAWPRLGSVDAGVGSTVGPIVGVAAVSPLPEEHATRTASANIKVNSSPILAISAGF